jgi:hypothetical protein
MARQVFGKPSQSSTLQVRKVSCATASWSACGLTPPCDRRRGCGCDEVSAERGGAGDGRVWGDLGAWSRGWPPLVGRHLLSAGGRRRLAAALRSQGGVKPLALQDAVAWFGVSLGSWKSGWVWEITRLAPDWRARRWGTSLQDQPGGQGLRCPIPAWPMPHPARCRGGFRAGCPYSSADRKRCLCHNLLGFSVLGDVLRRGVANARSGVPAAPTVGGIILSQTLPHASPLHRSLRAAFFGSRHSRASPTAGGHR